MDNMRKLGELFIIGYGSKSLHNKENLDYGSTLVISSKGVDNGYYGFFDTPVTIRTLVISVPSTGSVGEAFVQTYPCAIDDNCLVLIPKTELTIEYLFYIAQILRNEKWRYRYGRQITPTRIENMEVMPENNLELQCSYNELKKETDKKKQNLAKILEYIDNSFTDYKEVLLTTLFKVTNAKSKGFKRYKHGKIPFISNGFADNGLVGFVTPNKNDRVFNKDSICISAFCEATVQKAPFLPRGNGGSGLKVITPLNEMNFEELLFNAAYINRVYSWKFSYGRMVTSARIKEMNVLSQKII